MDNDNLRQQFIAVGIKTLNKRGHKDANKEKVFSEKYYSDLFVSVLKDHIGKSYSTCDDAINSIISDIELKKTIDL